MLPYENLFLDDLEGEVWADIEGYDGIHKVSNLGRIKSLEQTIYYELTNSYQTFPSIIRKQQIVSAGYLGVGIKRKTFLVHRLVGKYHLPNPNNLPHINHKKGNKKDNRHFELEWATPKDNKIHAMEILDKRGESKIVLDTKTGVYYNSMIEANLFWHRKYHPVHFVKMLTGIKVNKTSMIIV